MNRCFRICSSDTRPHRLPLVALALWVTVCLGTFLAAQSASAQAVAPTQNPANGTPPDTAFERVFPLKTMRGVLTVTASPEVLLDGKADRLSPGARVRDVANRVLQPASITGVRLAVNYVRDAGGDLNEVWILSEAEVKKVLPTMAAKRSFLGGLFDTTPKTATDDGNTPYDKLPRYK